MIWFDGKVQYGYSDEAKCEGARLFKILWKKTDFRDNLLRARNSKPSSS